MPEMTLSEAARWAGVTRATIHKALKGGRLSGRKDDSGEWRIDPSELERVYQPGKTVDALVDAPRDGVSNTDIAELIAAKDREMGLLRELLAEIRAQRDDAVEQRDRAMELAEAQTRLLTHQQERTLLATVPAPRGRLLGWFRRSGAG
jgi:predicted transcriptional regulator